jgi:beta-glucosidase
VDDLPAFDDYNMKGRTYRYFEGKPQFGFGYGLSFTTFKYSKLQLSDKTLGKDSIVVKFEITNTGKRAGDEVCQLYLQQKGSKAVSLQGFERVNLAKGETKTITMSITSEQLEDMTGQTVDNLTGVEFRLIVGGANPRTKSQKLKSAFFVK